MAALGWAAADLAVCAALPNLTSVVVPKTETPHDLRTAEHALDGTPIRLQALVETPLGLQNIIAIAAATPRLDAVIIGYADLGAALGRARSANPAHWLAVQDTVLIAAPAAGIQAIDGPHLGTRDDESFRHAVDWAATLGFDGKWVIHPTQIDTATSAFTPSPQEIEQARRVLDALADAETRGDGAAQLDGQMLDEAIAVAARRVLANSAKGRP